METVSFQGAKQVIGNPDGSTTLRNVQPINVLDWQREQAGILGWFTEIQQAGYRVRITFDNDWTEVDAQTGQSRNREHPVMIEVVPEGKDWNHDDRVTADADFIEDALAEIKAKVQDKFNWRQRRPQDYE